MSATRTAEFFDSYASDFAAIYGGSHSGLSRWVNLVFRRSMRLRYEHTLAACSPLPGRTVLDIGCGPGHYTVALATGGASVTGIDFAEGMIALARERATRAGVLDRCKFIVGDFSALNSPEPFDYVVVMGVMDYIAEPREFLTRALALTKRRAVFSFPVAGGLLGWQRQLRYKARCPLYLYEEHAIQRLFAGLGAKSVKIDKLARDFFVTAEMP